MKYWISFFLWIGTSANLWAAKSSKIEESAPFSEPFSYKAKDFSYLLDMKGLSNSLLQQHFSLYQGYVNQTNILLNKLISLLEAKNFDKSSYSAIKKAFGFEFDGMKLHEYFFGNLAKQSSKLESYPIAEKMKHDFGSIDFWQKDLTSTCLVRGIGWAITYYDKTADRFINTWIDGHDKGAPIYDQIVLVIDCWEHAYLQDFGIARDRYVATIMEHIDWSVVNQRWNQIKD